jgi:ammonium transporter, Amt family
MLKNLLDACGAGLAFYAFGYALAYGDDVSDMTTTTTFAGNKNFFLSGDVNPAIFFFQYAFSATCVTIIAGTLAERCRMASYFAYSLYLTGFVYPIVVHSIWSSKGFLSIGNSDAAVGIGMVDFAGSGVVHMTGGCTSLFATYILGPRQGRFYDRHGRVLSKPGLTKGQSVALQLLGTFILFFGWFGFNPGSALSLSVQNRGTVAAVAAVNTTLSAAAGTISALFTNAFIQRHRIGEFDLDVVMAMNGWYDLFCSS